jgi:hypothetical protein
MLGLMRDFRRKLVATVGLEPTIWGHESLTGNGRQIKDLRLQIAANSCKILNPDVTRIRKRDRRPLPCHL